MMTYHVGERKKMNCGMMFTISECYRKNGRTLIAGKFEDGTVVKDKQYDNFQKGNIANPSLKNHVGERKKMNCGMMFTVTECYTKNKKSLIAGEFEDGTVVKDKTYYNFLRGSITNPKLKVNHVGERKMMNCGMMFTVTECYTKNKKSLIAGKFEDGTVVKDKLSGNFLRGSIANPMVHVGERKKMNCGMMLTITEWYRKNGKSLIVGEFEDGTVVKNKLYENFRKGKIANPMVHVGERKMMNCGMMFTITECYTKNGKSLIAGEFEDGTVVKDKTYSSFKKVKIANPNFKNKHYHNFVITKIRESKEYGKIFYKCYCTNCGARNLMTPQMMLEHEKSCNSMRKELKGE